MKPAFPLLCLMCASPAIAGFDTSKASPPVAARQPKDVSVHGDKRLDDYFWLREKDNPAVLAHLRAENAHTEAVLAPAQALRDELYREMVARIKETDATAPFPYRGYLYYSRTEQGKQYSIYCRRRDAAGAAEEILFDLNQLGAGRPYVGLGNYTPSDDGRFLIYTIDWTGYRQYEVFVKNLATGELVSHQIGKVSDVEWGAGDDTLYYITENEAKRSDKLHRYTLSTGQHALLYEEKDELYDLNLTRARDHRYLFCAAVAKTSTEVRALRLDRPADEFQLLVPRTPGHEYAADHRDGRFYFVTNRDAKNFRVVTAPVDRPADWSELIPHRPAVKVEGVELFAGFMVVRERENGLPHLRVHDFATGRSRRLDLPEAAYALTPGANWEYATGEFRFGYQSMVTPPSVFAEDLATGARRLLKQNEVLGGFDRKNYRAERVYAPTADGTRIPLSVVYRADLDRSKPQPVYLYGYGSYGHSLPVSFDSNRVSLLDRGVIYAIAHVRGGGELGEEWREAGRMKQKMNTFTDFVACAEHLVRTGWTTPARLVTSGGSAGGLLVGAVLNLRPDLFRAAILNVPFVDVLNTMLDASLPLTTSEYIEWGNPHDREQYGWMRAYSPYDNLRATAYPHLLVNVSYHDSQVPYWEGAKYVARLRTLKTDQNVLLLRATLEAGHGGASGRYDALKDVARNHAFLLSALEAGRTDRSAAPPSHPSP